ncbi:signal transduction histidine kinase [Anaerovibrio sp. JC8]|uniref:sensor histidine kinase n=1 Tax=Anaerovibrio sp. JC8 TaxID=1240085 RepID=UPI000A0D3606|nr:histidine kinase N-terminal domain-containing protein [Anaerovibrio sp. JC8]ORT99454.1 signal transduction histidine kinase [Anaerovibrio sp. JC8]
MNHRESDTLIYRQHTDLTAVQIEQLRRMSSCFGFIADFAHAHLLLYVKTKEPDQYMVMKHHKPHTFYSQVELPKVGSVVPAQMEPLVAYVFEKEKSIHGRREWRLGMTLDMYAYPIKEGNEIIGVVTLETSKEYASGSNYYQLLDTAELLMHHAKRNIDTEKFAPIFAGTGVVISDKNNRITYVNLSAKRIYRALGINHLLGARLPDREISAMLHRETIDSSRPFEKEIQIGDMILLQRDIKLEEAGVMQRRILLLADVTEVRKKEREIKIKTAVIQEIHHRVKNNLQTIASLLRLQGRRSNSPEVKSALQESTNRILSIAVVHEFLSQHDKEEINVIEVTRNILERVAPNMVASDFQLTSKIEGPEVVLPSKNASNLAVIINELILNSIEHGFEGRDHGMIGLRTAIEEDGYRIELYDDGIGVPEDFDMEKSKSLGLQIIKTLVNDDIGGRFEITNDNGAHCVLHIPKG